MSCQPDFLDVKSDKRLVVPQTLKDLQAILDNVDKMNKSMPYLGEVGSDDYYVEFQTWETMPISTLKEAYIWEHDFSYQGDQSNDWNWRYEQIFYSNIVLERVDRKTTDTSNSMELNEIKGSALFHRAWAFYQLAQLFCPPYDSQTAREKLGVPLRLESDINLPVSRPSLEETYRRIEQDLLSAIEMLPETTLVPTRPSAQAARALVARIYLLMEEYEKALSQAELLVRHTDDLLDYATIDTDLNYPFEPFNKEVIFYSTMLYPIIMAEGNLIVDSVLYDSYRPNDVRRKAYFYETEDGKVRYKGSYSGSHDFFVGITSGELYIILAECLVRLGRSEEAKTVMEEFLKMRYVGDMTLNIETSNSGAMLKWVLEERRKELVYRGLRWSDLRRFNKDERLSKTLVRNLGGQRYELPSNDLRYVYPIPQSIIDFSGIDQNPR